MSALRILGRRDQLRRHIHPVRDRAEAHIVWTSDTFDWGCSILRRTISPFGHNTGARREGFSRKCPIRASPKMVGGTERPRGIAAIFILLLTVQITYINILHTVNIVM